MSGSVVAGSDGDAVPGVVPVDGMSGLGPRARVLGVVLLVWAFLAVYGLNVIEDIRNLTHSSVAASSSASSHQTAGFVAQIVLGMVGLALGVAALLVTCTGPRGLLTRVGQVTIGWRRPGQVWAGLVSLGWVWIVEIVPALTITFAGHHWLHLPAPVYTWAPAPGWIDVGRSLYAGITEELLVVTMPLTYFWCTVPQARRRRWMSMLVCTVLIAARISYHLYYGWEVSAMLLWAISMPLIFWRYRQAWALIVGHIVYDIVTFGTLEYAHIETICEGLAAAGAVLVVVAGPILRRRGPAPWQLETTHRTDA